MPFGFPGIPLIWVRMIGHLLTLDNNGFNLASRYETEAVEQVMKNVLQ